jgi:archaeal type IV pilus assembly protein PilA
MHNEAKESAVSEIIGVILVVSLTVIMAGIIGAYLFGYIDSGIVVSHIITLTARQVSPSVIEVTYRGGPDYANLQNLTITWPSGTQQYVPFPKIGDIYRATNYGPPYNVTPGDDRVVVVGHFPHGATQMSQVVLDTKV